MRHAYLITGRDDGVALVKTRIRRLDHGSGQIDAADAGEAADDAALAGGGKGVLVINARISDANDHFALVELCDGGRLECAADLFPVLAQSVGFEILHDPSGNKINGDVQPPLTSRTGGVSTARASPARRLSRR